MQKLFIHLGSQAVKLILICLPLTPSGATSFEQLYLHTWSIRAIQTSADRISHITTLQLQPQISRMIANLL